MFVITYREVGSSYQLLVAPLRRHSLLDLSAFESRTTHDSINTQLSGTYNHHTLLHATVESARKEYGALQNRIFGTRKPLLFGPLLEIVSDGRMNYCIQLRQSVLIGKNFGSQTGSVDTSRCIDSLRAEKFHQSLLQQAIVIHQILGARIGVVTRSAQERKKTADSAFPTANQTGYAYSQHLFYSLFDGYTSGKVPIEITFMSALRTEIAFCSENGLMTTRSL